MFISTIAVSVRFTGKESSAGTAVGIYAPRMRDIDTIYSELRSVAGLRRAARERGGPLPSIDVAAALLDETPRVRRDGSGHLVPTAPTTGT